MSSAAATGGRRRRTLRALALLFSALCLAWVLWPVVRHTEELAASVQGTALVAWVLGGTLAYAAISVLLAAAWWWLAGIYGRDLGWRAGYSIWARSQWAKYLPGNAFHYVSRQMLGRRAGLSHPALLASSVLELASLLLAAVLIGLAGSTLRLSLADRRLSLVGAVLLAVALLSAWPAVDRLLRKWPRGAAWMHDLPRLGVLQTWRLLGPATLLHLAFFVATGALLYGILRGGWGALDVDAWRIFWLFAVAWLAGTITLGAPAGAGVREAVLTLELASMIGPANASALALALRIVTTGGDCLSALIGWWLRDQPRDHRPAGGSSESASDN